jgi:hypothetical protein
MKIKELSYFQDELLKGREIVDEGGGLGDESVPNCTTPGSCAI